jgi:hypothetical protein
MRHSGKALAQRPEFRKTGVDFGFNVGLESSLGIDLTGMSSGVSRTEHMAAWKAANRRCGARCRASRSSLPSQILRKVSGAQLEYHGASFQNDSSLAILCLIEVRGGGGMPALL